MPDNLKSLLIESMAKFEATAEIVATHLRHVLIHNKLVDPQVVSTRVSSRVKTIRRILRKIARKKKRERPQFNTLHDVEIHINDLAGARVVCDYLSDVAFIHAYLQLHPAFKILPTKTEDYIAHPKDGYRGVHLVVEVQTTFGRARCEIQLRTMLQHAWAEKNHALLYTLGSTKLRRVPKGTRALMDKQSDLLYNMDEAALLIADAVRKAQRRTSGR